LGRNTSDIPPMDLKNGTASATSCGIQMAVSTPVVEKYISFVPEKPKINGNVKFYIRDKISD
jgi:hypothetical protein